VQTNLFLRVCSRAICEEEIDDAGIGTTRDCIPRMLKRSDHTRRSSVSSVEMRKKGRIYGYVEETHAERVVKLHSLATLLNAYCMKKESRQLSLQNTSFHVKT
jgi:hypothetical protein